MARQRCRLDGGGAQRDRAKPSRAEPSRAEPSRAKPSRTKPSRATIADAVEAVLDVPELRPAGNALALGGPNLSTLRQPCLCFLDKAALLRGPWGHPRAK